METAVVERRAAPRLPPERAAVQTARLRTGQRLAVLNIGRGGALVESSARLLPGSAVEIQVPGATADRYVRAVVLRCTVSAVDPARGVRYTGALAFAEPLAMLA